MLKHYSKAEMDQMMYECVYKVVDEGKLVNDATTHIKAIPELPEDYQYNPFDYGVFLFWGELKDAENEDDEKAEAHDHCSFSSICFIDSSKCNGCESFRVAKG